MHTFCEEGKSALELNMIAGIWHIEVVKHPLYLVSLASYAMDVQW